MEDPLGYGSQNIGVQYIEAAGRPPDNVTAVASGIDVRMYLAVRALDEVMRLKQ